MRNQKVSGTVLEAVSPKPTEKLWVRVPAEIRKALEIAKNETGISFQQIAIDALSWATRQANGSRLARLNHVRAALARKPNKKKHGP
jgi:hypothetical protein